ncbi:MAG: hypothetical protein PWQ42_356 [Sulfurospirillum sp.]|nr:hypothetical protein [Sulfurospirillum sp.]DAB33683.1 MAG TPA: hypothetical protein CFH82_09170 [Sulfurospirillum sp. UBA12182]
MLLIKLDTREKFAFLRLAQFLAKIDGLYSEKEKDLIDEYCFEMGIDNLEFENDNLEEILQEFKSNQSKKIVLLELMILAHVDDAFNEEEYQIIKKIKEIFKISKKEFSHYSSWGKAVAALREQAISMSLD